MFNFLYLLIPCLGLSVFVLILQMMQPLFTRNHKKDIENAKKKWISAFFKEDKYSEKTTSKRYAKLMSSQNSLIAFSEIIKDEAYKEKCMSVLMNYSYSICNSLFKKANNIIAGFFCHIISTLDMSNFTKESKENYLFLSFAFSRKKSVYCHENALRVFYAFGDEEFIIRSFKHFSSSKISQNEKLLSDGLMNYKGDKKALANILIINKSEFSLPYQIATVQFLRGENIHNFDDILVKELVPTTDVDYRCEILRLIGKEKSDRNKNILLAALKDGSFSEIWQPAAVAAHGLSLYLDEQDVLNELAKSCCSPYWSVRVNSANALVDTDSKGSIIKQVIDGTDRYARDAVNYALATKKEGK